MEDIFQVVQELHEAMVRLEKLKIFCRDLAYADKKEEKKLLKELRSEYEGFDEEGNPSNDY